MAGDVHVIDALTALLTRQAAEAVEHYKKREFLRPNEAYLLRMREEAVTAATPGIERAGANQRTRDIAFKVRNCLDATGAGKWRHADAILRLAYPDAFDAEVTRLKVEGGSDAGH